MDETRATSWAYVNDLRVGTIFLGVAMGVFGMGIVVVVVSGEDGTATADLFLAIGIFLMVFTVLLTLPRIRTRGAVSYSLLVERSMDSTEDLVRKAIEETGRKVRVEVKESRSSRPPRTVHVEDVATRFLLCSAPYREERGKGTSWTEIVQAGNGEEGDDIARDLRDRIVVCLGSSESEY